MKVEKCGACGKEWHDYQCLNSEDKMNKVTADQVMESEKNMLVEAIGCEIELTNQFLEYCPEPFRSIMLSIPYNDRGYILSSCTCEAWFNGSPPSNNSQDIWLNVSEIEFQFEGEPEDAFDDPDDWYIDGDLAYLNVGYGLSIEYDIKELQETIALQY